MAKNLNEYPLNKSIIFTVAVLMKEFPPLLAYIEYTHCVQIFPRQFYVNIPVRLTIFLLPNKSADSNIRKAHLIKY